MIVDSFKWTNRVDCVLEIGEMSNIQQHSIAVSGGRKKRECVGLAPGLLLFLWVLRGSGASINIQLTLAAMSEGTVELINRGII